MEFESLISIITPAYNSEKYIESTILSVINQTYKNWEMIIIDDSSKDSTHDIISRYNIIDSRIRVISLEKNSGVSNARNIGISKAQGSWIAFLDSDDIWQPTKLEKQIELINREKVEFVFTGSSFIDSENKPLGTVFEVPEKISYKKLRNHNVISCSSVLINKRFFSEFMMENDGMSEDYALWLKILNTGIDAYGINLPLLVYRISSSSKSGNKFKSFGMAYKVFRLLGYNIVRSTYFTMRHLFASFKKYKKIYF